MQNITESHAFVKAQLTYDLGITTAFYSKGSDGKYTVSLAGKAVVHCNNKDTAVPSTWYVRIVELAVEVDLSDGTGAWKYSESPITEWSTGSENAKYLTLILYDEDANAIVTTNVPLVANGVGIVNVNTYYALSGSSTDAPADNAFKYDTISADDIKNASADSSTDNDYLWTGNQVTYSDQSTAILDKAFLAPVKYVNAATEQYATSDSNENKPGSSSFSDEYPTIVKGLWVWTRTKLSFTLTDGVTTISYTDPICVGYISNDGAYYQSQYGLSNSCMSHANKDMYGWSKDGRVSSLCITSYPL